MPVAARDHGGVGPEAGPAAGPPGALAGPRWRRLVPGIRPRPAWLAPFAVTLGVLLIRNAYLFSTPEYEQADMGADSILIEQARRFTLLTGNYSRKGFNHPGPGFLYVESWGESVFWALLRLVPTGWNGQLIALYALNALFASGVVAVAYGWTRSARGGLAAGAVVACFGAAHPAAFSSDWMPYVYVPAFLAFTVALASVAAGRGPDLWLAVLSGWFLVHGHAAFLFIVPAMAVVPAVVRAWPRLRAWPGRRASGSPAAIRSPGALARAAARRRRAWLPAVVISVVFALPMVMELVLHGPGDFASYLAYGSSSSAGGHSPAQVAGYVLWFWWPGGNAWAAPLLLVPLAVLLTWWLPAGPVRRLCVSLLLIDALAVAAVVAYVVAGVDQIGDYYIGYFSWATPAVVLLVIALAGTELLARWPARGRRAAAAAACIAALACAAACAAFAAAPDTRTSTADVDPLNPPAGQPTNPELGRAVATMGTLAAGRMIVLLFPHNAWPYVTGILVQAERTGVRACVEQPSWAFMMSKADICTAAELRGGYRMTVYDDPEIPPGAHPVARLQRAIVTPGTPAT